MDLILVKLLFPFIPIDWEGTSWTSFQPMYQKSRKAHFLIPDYTNGWPFANKKDKPLGTNSNDTTITPVDLDKTVNNSFCSKYNNL